MNHKICDTVMTRSVKVVRVILTAAEKSHDVNQIRPPNPNTVLEF